MDQVLIVLVSFLKYAGDNDDMIPVRPEIDVEEVDVNAAWEEATDNTEIVLMEVWVDTGAASVEVRARVAAVPVRAKTVEEITTRIWIEGKARGPLLKVG